MNLICTENANGKNSNRKAFTLVEMLVVIAIIGILGSFLLPALGRAKERTRMAQCVNNMGQIAIGVALYNHDNQDKFPRAGFLGGFDPQPTKYPCLNAPEKRKLYSYIKPSEVFRCPMDKGITYCSPPCYPLTDYQYTNTCWDTTGCSYFYNDDGYGIYRKFKSATTLPLEKTAEVPSPSTFILLYEPPATGWGCLPVQLSFFLHWHYWPVTKQVFVDNVTNDPARFISPIAFVDGHAAYFDVTDNIRANSYYANEATKDWVWYQPVK